MLRFYWSVGEDIEKQQYENRYGSHFYENVSKDLRGILNLKRGMSATTIKYTCYFYRLYSQLFENRQGVIDDSSVDNRQGVTARNTALLPEGRRSSSTCSFTSSRFTDTALLRSKLRSLISQIWGNWPDMSPWWTTFSTQKWRNRLSDC